MTDANPSGAGPLAPTPCNSAPAQIYDEQQLEAAISTAMARMCAATTRDEKMQYWREMCALIDQRTPSRRRFMARTQGLA